MTLFRLKTAPLVLIEDYIHNNILPLLLELLHDEKKQVNLFCYEQSIILWKNALKIYDNISYYDEFNPNMLSKYTNEKSSVIIYSINQMALFMGWSECLKYIKILQNNINVNRIILVLHKDCIPHSAKLHAHLNHLVNAIVSYSKCSQNIEIFIKKGTKIIKSEETILYDAKNSTLKLTPVIKHEKKDEEQVKLSPGNLSTFKIEVDQNEKIQKYNLKLPYMSKIHDGQSKVYYEPDSVDDWDEEDPDEDLDI